MLERRWISLIFVHSIPRQGHFRMQTVLEAQVVGEHSPGFATRYLGPHLSAEMDFKSPSITQTLEEKRLHQQIFHFQLNLLDSSFTNYLSFMILLGSLAVKKISAKEHLSHATKPTKLTQTL